MTPTPQQFDPQLFRDVLGHYPTGVVIVTGVHPDGEALAMVVGTFTAVSMHPPLVAFLPMRTSRTFSRLAECESMCINVLTGEQETVGRTIASRRSNKLEDVHWNPSPSGSPILAESLAWLDVSLDQTIEAGDHWIALCQIRDMAVNNPKAPLIFFQGGYGSFAVPPLLARIDHEIIVPVQQASRARELLSALAHEHACEATLLTVVNRDELAAIATAVGEGVHSDNGLGRRVPIVPPIADVWVAELSEEEQTHWLSKAEADDETLDTFRERLAFARTHGYLMSFLPAGQLDPYKRLNAATQRYASGALTPTDQREIKKTISNVSISYQMREIELDETYDVGMLVAAVHDPAGTPVRMLRMARLPRQASGRTVLTWIEALRTTVSQLERRLFPDEEEVAAV